MKEKMDKVGKAIEHLGTIVNTPPNITVEIDGVMKDPDQFQHFKDGVEYALGVLKEAVGGEEDTLKLLEEEAENIIN